MNKPLIQLGMVTPNRSAKDLYDNDLQRKRYFDIDALNTYVESNVPKLTTEQNKVYGIQNQSGGWWSNSTFSIY